MISPQQSLEAHFTPTVLHLFLSRLAIFCAASMADDVCTARQTAAAMLAGYNPQSIEELTLAAEVTALRLQALEALGQAALPDMPLNKVMRLRGSAVSLNREAERCRVRLERLQTESAQPTEEEEPASAAASQHPGAEKAAELLEFTRDALAAATKGPREHQAFSQAHKARLMAQRIVENGRKAAERHAAAMQAQGTGGAAAIAATG